MTLPNSKVAILLRSEQVWQHEKKQKKSENYKIELLPFDKVSKKIEITIFGQQATYTAYPSYSFSDGKNSALNIHNVVEIDFMRRNQLNLCKSAMCLW